MTSRRARKHLQPPRRPPTGPVPRLGDRLPEGGGGGAIVRFAFPGPPRRPPYRSGPRRGDRLP